MISIFSPTWGASAPRKNENKGHFIVIDQKGLIAHFHCRSFQPTCYAEVWSVLSHSPNRIYRTPEFPESWERQIPGLAELRTRRPGDQAGPSSTDTPNRCQSEAFNAELRPFGPLFCPFSTAFHGGFMNRPAQNKGVRLFCHPFLGYPPPPIYRETVKL